LEGRAGHVRLSDGVVEDAVRVDWNGRYDQPGTTSFADLLSTWFTCWPPKYGNCLFTKAGEFRSAVVAGKAPASIRAFAPAPVAAYWANA
jgi:hypothetical protein